MSTTPSVGIESWEYFRYKGITSSLEFMARLVRTIQPCKCGSVTHQRTSHAACPQYKPKVKKRYRQDDLPKATSVVMTGIKNFAKVDIQGMILQTTKTITRLSLEASRFLNGFLVYSLAQGVVLPNVSESDTFFGNLYRAFEARGNRVDEGKVIKDPFPNHFFNNVYMPIRGNLSFLDTNMLAQIVTYSSRLYKTNCMNHVVLNFEKRLKYWLHYKIRKHCLVVLPRDKVKTMANFVFNHVIRNTVGPIVLPIDIRNAVQENQRELLLLLAGFLIAKTRDMMGGLVGEPTQSNWWNYLPTLYRILKRIEKHYNNNDTAWLFTGRRGCKPKLFSLAPVCSFASQHIHLDTTGLYYLLKKDGYELPTIQVFKDQAREYWYGIFRLGQLETVNSKFAYYITTNGLEVAVHMEKPGPVGQFVNDWGYDYNGDYHPVVVNNPRSVLGLDPGRSSLFTAVNGDFPERKFQCRNSRWREISGATYSQKKVKAWMKSNIQMRQTVTEIPTPRTSSWTTFTQHIWYLYTFLPEILDFYG